MAALVVDGEAGGGNDADVAILGGDGLQVVVHPLPELALPIIGLGLVEAGELGVHVHHLLAVGMLRRRGRLDHPDLARLPLVLRVPVRPVVQVDHRELGVAGGLLVPGLAGGVGHRQDPALAEQLVLRVPGRVGVEDLDVVAELVGAADRVHPGAAGQPAGAPHRLHVGPGILQLGRVVAHGEQAQAADVVGVGGVQQGLGEDAAIALHHLLGAEAALQVVALEGPLLAPLQADLVVEEQVAEVGVVLQILGRLRVVVVPDQLGRRVRVVLADVGEGNPGDPAFHQAGVAVVHRLAGVGLGGGQVVAAQLDRLGSLEGEAQALLLDQQAHALGQQAVDGLALEAVAQALGEVALVDHVARLEVGGLGREAAREAERQDGGDPVQSRFHCCCLLHQNW